MRKHEPAIVLPFQADPENAAAGFVRALITLPFSSDRFLSIILTLMLASVMAACSPVEPESTESPGQGSGEPDEAPSLAGTSWNLVTFGQAGALEEPAAGASVTLDFEEDRAGGRAACNWYGGTYEVLGSRLIWSNPFFDQTEMACEPELMELESAFLAMLAGDKVVTLEGSTLTLEGESGILVFEKPANSALEGTPWVLTGLPRQGAVVQTWVDADITMLFEDGRVSGSAGCNTYSGSYELDGSSLSLGPVITTRMACEEEIMERENAFLAGLENIASFEVQRETAILSDADGNFVMSLATGESMEP